MEEVRRVAKVVSFENNYKKSKKNNNISFRSGNPAYIKNMNSNKEVSVDMDENKILEKYLDKVDQDRREQEQRLNSNMEKLEERLSKERIASEERLEKLFNSTMDSIKETNAKIDKIDEKLGSKIDSINDKIDTKIDSINNKIDSKVDLMSEKIDSTNKWIIGTCIATILSIAAMVITLIIFFIQSKS